MRAWTEHHWHVEREPDDPAVIVRSHNLIQDPGPYLVVGMHVEVHPGQDDDGGDYVAAYIIGEPVRQKDHVRKGHYSRPLYGDLEVIAIHPKGDKQ